MTSALQPPWAPCAEAPSEAEGAQVAWPRTHSAMEPRSVGFQVEGFHVLTFLSLSHLPCVRILGRPGRLWTAGETGQVTLWSVAESG